MKKIIITLSLIVCSSYFALAQTAGSPAGNAGSSDGGKEYSNGYIPNANVERQFNVADSTASDTTYREQQWNGASAKKDSTQKKTPHKKNTQTTHKTTTTKKTTVTTTSKNK